MPLTNDVVEVYEDDGGKWRWRRTAPNGAVISGSEESFDNKTNAARAARRANPESFDDGPHTEGAVPDLNAPVDAGLDSSPGPDVTPPATTTP